MTNYFFETCSTNELFCFVSMSFFSLSQSLVENLNTKSFISCSGHKDISEKREGKKLLLFYIRIVLEILKYHSYWESEWNYLRLVWLWRRNDITSRRSLQCFLNITHTRMEFPLKMHFRYQIWSNIERPLNSISFEKFPLQIHIFHSGVFVACRLIFLIYHEIDAQNISTQKILVIESIGL